jgi:hypothetical protein
MPRARADRTAALAFDAITVEGALIAPAMFARIAQHQAEEQSEADYGVPKGLTLRDEIARYFRIGQAAFKELTASETPSLAATTTVVEKLLRDVFGFADLRRVGTRTISDRQFTLTFEALGGRVPIVVVPPADDLDRPSPHLTTDGRKRSAASTLRDWLNAEAGSLWGLCSNGARLRLTRDNSSLTRPAYIEADLRRIFEADLFADFAALWLVLHGSRFGIAGTPPAVCPVESGARPAFAKVLPPATSCATASRRRSSASATDFYPIPTTARCERSCKKANCLCRTSSASCCAWSIA